MSTSIVSINGRAQTGISRPYLCEDGGGHIYYVKSRNVDWDQLVLEWILAKLARECGLPVAPFELLEIPDILCRQTIGKEMRDLQPGMAFGSRRVPFGEDVSESHLRHIPEDIKIATLCFDWWVRNADRRLGLMTSSPNVIWDPTMQQIALIDHDRALDEHFEPEEFLREHVFRDVRPFIEKPILTELRTKFESALYHLSSYWEELPGEWLADEAGNSRATLDMHEIESALLKPKLPVDGMLA